MITRFRLENFKAHRDTDLALHQFTVLVGDNSSGKTSVLEALRLVDELTVRASKAPSRSRFDAVVEEMMDELTVRASRAPGAGGSELLAELVRQGTAHLDLSWSGQKGGHPWAASLVLTKAGSEPWKLRISGEELSRPFTLGEEFDGPGWPPLLSKISSLTGRVALYRFHSDQIAASAYSNHPAAAVAEDGALTAVALAALKLADDEAFERIESAMRRLVPSLQRVFIKPATVIHPSNPNPVTGSKLYFDFRGSKGVPAHHASQGTLVVLALLTVLHGPNRPSVILLDDFDQALHPRAQMELVRMIKELLTLDEFKDTQIIATTHSPFVLDEVTPSDVIAFALRDDGTVAAKPLSEHPDAPRVNGSLKAGELWTLDAERDWVR